MIVNSFVYQEARIWAVGIPPPLHLVMLDAN